MMRPSTSSSGKVEPHPERGGLGAQQERLGSGLGGRALRGAPRNRAPPAARRRAPRPRLRAAWLPASRAAAPGAARASPACALARWARVLWWQ